MQQKIDELLKILRERYYECEKVTCLPGSFKDYKNCIRKQSDTTFRMAIPSSDKSFKYDEENDTLCVWGRGIGLIYKQGLWAAKEGELGPVYIPVQIYSPEIY